MRAQTLVAATLAALAASTALPAFAEPVFNRIATFPVNTNIPADADQKTVSSAEIIAASEDGMMLVYSDSPMGGIGFVDIADAKAPKAGGFVKLDGEPTSVTVAGGNALVAVNTSESYTNPSGKLVVVDLAAKTAGAACDLAGQPDSIAISKDKSFVAIAIENERDEDAGDGGLPQMPAGALQIVPLKDNAPDCAGIVTVDMTGLSGDTPEDPEPEFVSINDAGEIAVTLQENNAIAIVGKDGKVISHFSAGAVDLKNVDTAEEGALTFDSELTGVVREPDAVKWLDNDRLVVANEGDWKGGSRGFTIFSKTGEMLWDSGLGFEYQVALHGHYPEGRSGNKGVEPEGLEVATFNGQQYIFVLSERGSVIGVYKDAAGAEPAFSQILPSGLSPEGAVAIPSRNLLAVANEVDLIEDGGVRSHVTLYELAEGEQAYPTLVSAMDGERPLGWGAMSGLVADAEKPGILYAVNDSVYGNQPTIFTIDATAKPAKIVSALRITRAGAPAQLMDMEGITLDGKGGFWVASEGRQDRMIPHGILNVTAKGAIKSAIGLPEELTKNEKRFGFEGVTMIGEGDDATLWMAVQREWADDEKGFVKLVSYNIKKKEWGAVRYPLEPKGEGWVGLSEITAHGDHVYIVERDNQIGAAAKLKKLFRVAIADLNPGKLGEELPVVKKEEVRDFIPDMAAFNGYIVDKVEGFAIDAAGNGFVVTDNDGVDDSNGETLFWTIGKVE